MEASTPPPIVPGPGPSSGHQTGRGARQSVDESIPGKTAPREARGRGLATVGGTSIPSPVPHCWNCALRSAVGHRSIELVFLVLQSGCRGRLAFWQPVSELGMRIRWEPLDHDHNCVDCKQLAGEVERQWPCPHSASTRARSRVAGFLALWVPKCDH